MLSIAIRLLLRHSERTAITVLMLVPVVALLVSSNMVTSGYLQQASASVSLVAPSDAYVAYQAGSASPSASSLSYDAFVRIQGSGVGSPTPVLSFPSTVAYGVNSTSSSVLATNMTAFIASRHPIVYGKVAATASQVDAGAITAKILGIKVGDLVTVEAFSQTKTLTVVGVLNSTDESDTGLILPLSSSWALWPQTAGKISYVEFVSPDAGAVSSLSGNMTVIREEGIEQIARSFDSQTSGLLTNWTYVLFALAAAAAIAAASRVVTEVSREYETVRAIGARLSTARALVFYELLIITGISVLVGVAAGIVSTSILGTLFKAIDGLPLAPSISPTQLAAVGTASFGIILGAGSVSLAWLPRKLGEAGESP
ncbi:MAG TPA: ABC transporter permease [Nitrososphaerales archaeon]|nr:ABC transporter permease [Nitrososphaerales archaeon]